MGAIGCDIVARLLLDERRPERSGLRLVEWAVQCGASGIVLPHGAPVTAPMIASVLEHAKDKKRGLNCYIEVETATELQRPEYQGADGWVVRAGDGVEEVLGAVFRHAQRQALLLVSGMETPALLASLRAWCERGWVTLVYHAQREASTLLPMKHLIQDWTHPVGYADDHGDVWPALNSLFFNPRVVLKGLTLNRSLGGIHHQGGLYPSEFALLVEQIRQHEALRDGESWTGGGSERSAQTLDGDHTDSLVAARPLRAGQVIGERDLKSVPGLRGLTTSMLPRLLGARLLYDRQPLEPITFGVVEPLAAGVSEPSLDVSVVIRSKNEGRWIARTLAAVYGQRRPPKEIIVVDNASSDDTVAIARSHDCRVLTLPDDRFSFGRALNVGIEAAAGAWVVSLSAHCIPVHDRWLEALFVPGHAAVSTAAIYGRQEPLPDTSDFDKRDLWTTFGEELRVQQGRDYFFHNANSMIRKEVWTSIPFDERLSGVEDRDWAKNVLADGYRILYAPLASVHHYHGIHQGRNESRARRVVQVIELIQQRVPAELLSER